MMMKGDEQIHQDVLRELRWDSRVDETEVGVEVDQGVASLTATREELRAKAVASITRAREETRVLMDHGLITLPV